MKWFQIKAPDGRRIRQPHETLEIAKATVVKGYEVTGEVFGATGDGSGGYVKPLDGQSLMTMLLDSHGDELEAWLRKKGFEQIIDTTDRMPHRST